MIKEIAFIRHDGGISLQYEDDDRTNTYLITYIPAGHGKYALTNVAGPWNHVDKHGSEDPKDWETKVYVTEENKPTRDFLMDRSILFLTVLNATYGGGVAAAAKMWQGPKYGVDS